MANACSILVANPLLWPCHNSATSELLTPEYRNRAAAASGRLAIHATMYASTVAAGEP